MSGLSQSDGPFVLFAGQEGAGLIMLAMTGLASGEDNVAMLKADSIYFEAIDAAWQGRLDAQAVDRIYSTARKLKHQGCLEESARYFERVFQIWRTLKESGFFARGGELGSSADYLQTVFEEHFQLLESLGRLERSGELKVEALALAEGRYAAFAGSEPGCDW